MAVQQPAAECTAIFTACIVSNRPTPCAATIHKTCTDQQSNIPDIQVKGQCSGNTTNTLILANGQLYICSTYLGPFSFGAFVISRFFFFTSIRVNSDGRVSPRNGGSVTSSIINTYVPEKCHLIESGVKKL